MSNDLKIAETYTGFVNLTLTTYTNSYLFATLENGLVNAFTGALNTGVSSMYFLLDNYENKEKLFIIALDNLIKKNDFLQLTIQLDQELISEDEFYEELETNEAKYLIKINEELNEKDFQLASQILPKLNRFFSVDEVSELFSIPTENINRYLDSQLIAQNK